MSLVLSNIELLDFRNHPSLELDLVEGLNICIGPNAVGKTNTVEAIQLLTTGRSFRKPAPKELIREGCERSRITARITGDGRVLDHRCDITPSKRSFQKNGKKCSAQDISGKLMSILFNPDDLHFVKGSASARREELDSFASQANKGYMSVLSSYTRSIDQRNRLLKEPFVDYNLLDAWDDSIALGAATVLMARFKLFARLKEKVKQLYPEISHDEELDCTYICTAGEGLESLGKDELIERVGERIIRNREEDIRRQQTCIGPHRDDIAFTLNSRDVRTFASQGQQRSVVIAWKMAEVKVAAEITGSQPLLLLDDVMSELDGSRRTAMGEFIQGEIQTIVTTTNLGYFSDDLLERAEVIRFDG
ncbi:MAG: DNA replication/repair protein RecF [Atopobiaceae bacterium]|nr:DNA replication/repair protein RecF [Atopobiaceae bacterium]